MLLSAQEITDELLVLAAGPAAYQRGFGYHTDGRTGELAVHNHTDLDLHFTTMTGGSRGAAYKQDILLSREDSHAPLEVDGICTCPMEYNCKHVVAACLHYRDRALDELEGGTHDSADAFSQWLKKQTGHQGASGTAPSGEFLVYRLKQHARTDHWYVHCRIAKRKKNGKPGRGRQVNLDRLFNPFGGYAAYLTPADRDIFGQLTATGMFSADSVQLRGLAGAMALELMLASGRLFLESDPENPLFRGDERTLQLGWQEDGEALHLQGKTEPSGGQPVYTAPPKYIDPHHFTLGPLRVPDGLGIDWLQHLGSAPPVSRDQAESLSATLATEFPQLPTPTPIEFREIKGVAPLPALKVVLDQDELPASHTELHFVYEGIAISPEYDEDELSGEIDGELVRVHRDRESEAAAITRLHDLGLRTMGVLRGGQWVEVDWVFTASAPDATGQQALQAWLTFLDSGVPALEAEGWAIRWPDGPAPATHVAEAIEARVDEGQDWFDLHFDLTVDGRTAPLLPLVTQLLGDYTPETIPENFWLETSEGGYVQVEREQIAPVLQTIIGLHQSPDRDDESLRLSRLDAPRLLDLEELPIKGGEKTRALASNLTRFESLAEVPPPSGFSGDLREYQRHGVNWLQFLREYDLAGILADDMGLGKTVQTLAHLAIEKAAGRLTRPALVVAPTSLLSNWRREAEQFTPGLDVLVLHGPDRKQHFEGIDQADLVFTTYPLLPRDSEELLARRYSFLILDEAQQIKNPRAQAAQLVRRMEADHRLCLTGTPMENHLGELWALFDFLLPGFLGDREQFTRNYRTPIEKQGDSARLQQLHQRTAPFMLRRTKDRVATELPAKSELLRTTPIAGQQATLYESIRLTMEEKVQQAIASKGLARSQITILDALLKLRQVCCDPRLLPDNLGGGEAPSAKLQMLMAMLPEMLEEGRRVLLFSQFTTMLGLIEQELKTAGLAYSKLTGQTRKRDAAIQRFRGGEANLFLISLKAGGVGLNLTEADTVIHYDPWWNPAVEGQATDRAHRIGQDKPVFVYKLLTEGTVEEKILAMQAHKSRLAESVYQRGRRDTEEAPIDQAMVQALFSAD